MSDLTPDSSTYNCADGLCAKLVDYAFDEPERLVYASGAFHAVGETVLAVNIGSRHDHLRADGVLFAADTLGVGKRYAVNAATIDDPDAALYATEAWSDQGLSYEFALEDGEYLVTLHFAEIWQGAFADGARSFDVSIEGTAVEQALDIFAENGAGAPLLRSYVVRVVDGVLDIDLDASVQNPKLSALEIARLAPPSGNTPPIAVDDHLVIDFETDANVVPETGVAAFSTTKWDLFRNDRDDGYGGGNYSDLQLEIVEQPRNGVLQLAGEASHLTYVFDPENHPGEDSFRYRAFDEQGDFGNSATVSIKIDALPSPTPALGALRLIDKALSGPLLDLAPFVLLEADSVEGRSLGLRLDLDPSTPPVGSVRFTVGRDLSWVDNSAPYGSSTEDHHLMLEDGAFLIVAAELFTGRDAAGAKIGEIRSQVAVDDGVLWDAGYLTPDVIGLDETRMGVDRVPFFEAFDRIALFGDSGLAAQEVLERASVVGRGTEIDFGGGNVLTLDNFTQFDAANIL